MRKLLAFIFLSWALPAFGQGVSGAGNFGCNGATITGTAATSATSNNTVLASISTSPGNEVLVQLDQTSTITGGAISFQISYDNGTNYINVPVAQVLNPSTGAQLTNPYTLVASTNQAFLILLGGASSFQIKLTTVITGSATVTPYYTVLCTPATIGPLTLDSSGNLLAKVNTALPTGSNTVGKVDILGNSAASLDAVIGASAPANVLAEGLKDTSGNSQAARADTSGNQYMVPIPTAATTDSTSSCVLQSGASTNSTSCKGSAGNVYGIYIINTTTTNYFLRMYNSASAPTCSSATGFIETIPALGGAANGGGIARVQVAQSYGTGIGFCLTGGGSSTDNTNAATGVYVTILYK